MNVLLFYFVHFCNKRLTTTKNKMSRNLFWSPSGTIVHSIHQISNQNNSYHQQRSFGACQSNNDCTDPSNPYCNTSTGECFQCHTDEVCTDPPNLYCNTNLDECNACNHSKNTNWTSLKESQCSTLGNECVYVTQDGRFKCQCNNDPACDATSANPTCTQKGCVACEHNDDCPSWRSNCINSGGDQYNTANNGNNYKGYCCPTDDPNSCPT